VENPHLKETNNGSEPMMQKPFFEQFAFWVLRKKDLVLKGKKQCPKTEENNAKSKLTY